MKIKLLTPLGIYEQGRRDMQEDAICPALNELNANCRTFVVCDGLGGHQYGEVASAVVAQALHSWMQENAIPSEPVTEDMVLQAVEHAQAHLNSTNARFNIVDKPMGTTMTMLVMAPNGVVAAHIGDSRIYHIRPTSRRILYRSKDHSLVNDLFAAGRLTRAEAMASPKKNILTRAMLAAPMPASAPTVAFITDVQPGDYFLMCTDGVCGEIRDRRLLDVLCNKSLNNAQKMAAIQMLAQDGADNRTALLLQVESVEHEPGDDTLPSNEQQLCDKMVSRTTMGVMSATQMSNAATHGLNYKNEAFIKEPAEEKVEKPISNEQPENADEMLPPPIPEQEEDVEDAVMPEPDGTVEQLASEPPAMPETEEPIAAQPSRSGNNTKRIFMIALAALLLAGGIIAFVLTKKPAPKPAPTPNIDSLANPDVTIDSVLPEAPVDTFDVGTDVAVTPVPRVTAVPVPQVSYPKGSNVNVPRVKEDDPYPSAFNDVNDYKELEKNVPATPTEPEPQQAKAETPAKQSVPGAVPNRQTVGASNRGMAVPPPPSRRRSTQAPY